MSATVLLDAITVPANHEVQAARFRSTFQQNWMEDVRREYNQLWILSWLVPFIMILGMTLVIIVEVNYLPYLHIDGYLVRPTHIGNK